MAEKRRHRLHAKTAPNASPTISTSRRLSGVWVIIRIPAATTQPNITIVAPQHRRRICRSSSPTGEQPEQDQNHANVASDIAAGHPVIWITPLFCAKVVFGKAQSMAATIQLTPSAGYRPSAGYGKRDRQQTVVKSELAVRSPTASRIQTSDTGATGRNIALLN